MRALRGVSSTDVSIGEFYDEVVDKLFQQNVESAVGT